MHHWEELENNEILKNNEEIEGVKIKRKKGIGE